ncbi:MAG: Ig-like domain-containing protein [Myxococcota bacterium]
MNSSARREPSPHIVLRREDRLGQPFSKRGAYPILGIVRCFAPLGVLLLATTAAADLPNRSYTPDQQYQIISPQMGESAHNQPSVIGDALLLSGNGRHSLWDVSDPFRPAELSRFESPHSDGEAESHAISALTDGENLFVVMISGRGVDIWDLTDPEAPALLGFVELEGIDYGDNTEAVWGVSWQGDRIYVGGTNTGLHIVDASDVTAPRAVARIPTTELGGVSAGPLFAVGNLLVVSTPKEHAGLATLDISAPDSPVLLDFVNPDVDSYIGGFYGGYAYLLTPLRTYDVTTDPSDIQLISSIETEPSEYVSFGDGHLFLGALRPMSGIIKYDMRDPSSPQLVGRIRGRGEGLGVIFTDDQFSFPIGNVLVMSDDEVGIGSVLTVHDTRRDSLGPEVMYVNPKDGAVRQAPSTRIGLSLSDHIDLRTLSTETFIVRPVDGEPISGVWGQTHTTITFWPDAPLAENTTYEVILPAGGVTDLVGNPVPTEFRSTFSTGEDVTLTPCALRPTMPIEVGETATFEGESDEGATFRWDFGDGTTSDVGSDPGVTHDYDAPGRYPVVLEVSSPNGTARCSALQIVHRPIVEGIRAASSIVVDEARSRTWTVNPDAGTVTAVSVDGEFLFEVEVGSDPRGLALADGLWVAVRGDDALVRLDLDDGTELERIELRHGAAPFSVMPFGDARGAGVVATLEGLGALYVHSDVQSDIVELGEVGPLRGLAEAGGSLYVSRFLAAEREAHVDEVSPDLSAIARTFVLAHDDTPDASNNGRGVPNYLSAIAISPDGLRMWVPSTKMNTDRGLTRDGMALNTDNTVRTIVSQIDLASGAEDLGARIDIDNHDMAVAAVFSPVGDLIFVLSQGTSQVDVFDAVSGRLVAGFSTGLTPQGLALSNGRLFVQNTLARSISIFDVSGILDGSDSAARLLEEVRTVENEPLADEVLLGKQIFHNADSRQMSLDGYVSCASCHLDGAHDGRTWDFTDRGEGLRNTIDLRGRAGVGHGPVHWTANFDEIQDFENDIRAHFGGSGFLADADFEAEDRSDPLGAPKAGLSGSLDALAAYVGSLSTFPKSPFRTADGNYTEAAIRGRSIFEARDCLGCHAGERLTDSGFAMHDVGTLQEDSGMRRGEALTGLDTPTLRGVWTTAPYFHDGSAATLAAVLDQPGHGNAQELRSDEKADLIAFLLQLENEELGYPEPEPRCDDCASEGGIVGGGCSATGAPSGALVLLAFALFWRRNR